MATYTALKATKTMSTSARAVKNVNKAGETLGTCQTYFTLGQSILGLFGIPSGPTLDDVLQQLEVMHADMLAGFKSIDDRLDELQLASSLTELLMNLDFHYIRIQEICKEFHDQPEKRNHHLRELLIKTGNLTKVNDIMQCIYDARNIMLGDAPWTISIPEKSIGAIMAGADADKCGNERYEYLSAAVTYYSYNLVYLYEGLFVVNFIEAYFHRSEITPTVPSANVELSLQRINDCENDSPLNAYKPYFERRIVCARPPAGYSGNKQWMLFSFGEYLCYNLGTNEVDEGPYRLGSTVSPPPAAWNVIPPEYYDADAVYHHRSKSPGGIKLYDDYYFYFKGPNYTCVFWTESRIYKSGTINSPFPCSDGLSAAMQNNDTEMCYLFHNGTSGSERGLVICTKTSRNWFQNIGETYKKMYENVSGLLHEGGGGLPDQLEKMCAFSGSNAIIMTEEDDPKVSGKTFWRHESSQNVWDFLPGIADKVWYIRELMDRPPPSY